MSSKSVSKGSRVSSLLDQIGKHWQIPIQEHFEDHDLESIRNSTGKLLQLVSSQEKCRKELISNHERGITMLLSILRGVKCSDMQIAYNILYILNELLTSGKRVTIILDHDAIRHIFHVLEVAAAKNTGRELQVYEEVMAVLHTLLSKLGNKDKGFAVQARLCGAVSHTLVAIKQFQHSFKVLLPALQVLKIYANSSVNCVKMVKEGAVGLVVKVLSHCGLKRTVTLKLTLELLANLVKGKNGAKKAVQAGAVPILINMFLEWQRLDHRNRQINLRKAILSCLRGIVNSTSGRKALTELDGLKTFYSIGYDGLEQKEMDGIVKLLILILRRMVTKNLPVRYPKMLITFSVRGRRPGIKIRKVESKSSSAKGESYESASQGTTDLEESDADSEDECVLDTQEDDDEDERPEKTPPPVRESPMGSSSSTLEAERTDLDYYRAFVPELDEFEIEGNDDRQEEPVEDLHASFSPIVIPTASMEPEPNIACSYPHESTAIVQNGGSDVDTAAPGSAEVATMESMVGSIRLQNGNCGLKGSSEIRESTTCGATTIGLGETGHEERDSEERIPAYADSEVILKEVESGLFHLLPFVKRANPELHGHYPPADLEPLLERKPVLPRVMVFQDFARFLHPDKVINRVVYDLDELIRCDCDSATAKRRSSLSLSSSSSLQPKESQNLPSSSGTKQDVPTSLPLRFESRFECGNLRRAIQVRQHEYDLILSPDINTDHHHQWFYFEVQDMESGIPYKFNIINCEKFNSQFNFGMQPVLYSTKDAMDGRPGWERAGYNVCYYKNFFVRNGLNQTSMRYFYTTTFTIKFPYANDICYLAYHFPYSCSMLKAHLNNLETRMPPSVFYSRQLLCKTILGNPCEVLTITSRPNTSNDEAMQSFRKRPYIFLTCRVHPGESSSSWIMKGVLDFLLSATPSAELLRSTYVFKIVPMLNPDGVINGCHRCSVAGEDLNRKWLNPDPNLHPTIYHTKGLIQYLNRINKTPLVYCDFHGHSRRKNVFMYGCSMAATANARSQGNTEALKIFLPNYGELKAIRNSEGEEPAVTVISEDPGYKALPKLLNSVSPAFAIQNCNFVMEKSKEGTARIVVYKELGVLRSYTLESTYCGADQGPYKGYHFSTRELEEMGKHLCVGFQRLPPPCRAQVAEDLFTEMPMEGPQDPELSRLDEDQDFALDDLPLPSRLGLVREPVLQEMLGSAEDE